nr:MAG TPA: hypothetical protein [Caudoviricetes sp.]
MLPKCNGRRCQINVKAPGFSPGAIFRVQSKSVW